ncbi:MAG: FAD-dependent oxidoreductase [Streptosporangiales bacterium]|nr:FAD-dependent oxidoreductase [Streptosporangiales bacterium]
MRYHTSVEGIEQINDGVIVRLTDGSQCEVDLLVGADGVHSRVRELVFGPEHSFFRYLGHHVATYLVTDEDLNREVGMRYHAVVVPGLMAGAYALRDDKVALLLLRREVDPTLPEDPASALRRHFGDLDWIIPDVLRSCPQPPELYYDQVAQIEMDQWSRGRVVLLGDACGAVSLFAGHGASMAMAAAWMLTDELRRAEGDLPTALARYQQRMQPTIAEVQQLGRRVVKWMAPSSRSRIAALNWIMRLAAIPGANRLVFRSLSPGSSHTLIPSRPALPEQASGR